MKTWTIKLNRSGEWQYDGPCRARDLRGRFLAAAELARELVKLLHVEFLEAAQSLAQQMWFAFVQLASGTIDHNRVKYEHIRVVEGAEGGRIRARLTPRAQRERDQGRRWGWVQ